MMNKWNNNIIQNNGEINIVDGGITNVYNQNIISLNYEDINKIIKLDMNYSEFYNKYIEKFYELEDYAYNLIFGNHDIYQKEFEDNSLNFGKKLIDWLLCKSEFPYNELENFYKEIELEFKLEDKNILFDRWKANLLYFKGNIELAERSYSRIVECIKEKKQIPEWFINDICIDGRNIYCEYYKVFPDKNLEYQKILNESKQIYNPLIDRIKLNIFNAANNDFFKFKNKGENTIILGSELKDCLNMIQELLYFTILNGSITNIKIIRELIANIMYLYSENDDSEIFLGMTLKMLFIGGKIDEYKNLYNRKILQYGFINSDKFIKELIESMKSLFGFEIYKREIFLYTIYGNYLKSDIFNSITEKIYKRFELDNNEKVLNLFDESKAICNNIKRIEENFKLIDIFINQLNKGNNGQIIYIIDILGKIKLKQLNEENIEKYKQIIDIILDKVGVEYNNIYDCIYNIINEFPDMTKHYEDKVGEQLIYKNDEEIIKANINKLKGRYNKQKTAAEIIFADDMLRYSNSIKNCNYKNDNIRVLLERDYIPLAKQVLKSKEQPLYDKIMYIKTLMMVVLKYNLNELKKELIDIIENIENTTSMEYSIFLVNAPGKEELIANVIMCKFLFGNLSYEETLTEYIKMIIKSKRVINEVLDCILVIIEHKKGEMDNSILEKYYIIFLLCYKEEYISTRNKVIRFSKIFIGHNKYEEAVFNSNIFARLDNIKEEELGGYYYLIKEAENSEIIKNISSKLKNSRNYKIKYIINEEFKFNIN